MEKEVENKELILRITFLFLMTLGLNIPSQAQIGFEDVTDSSGIDHHFQVYQGMFGGGACVIDFDKDGFEDIYITSGTNDDVFYKNNGDGTFKNVFAGSGLEATQEFVTQGVTSADVNRDGWPDLFITTITSRKEKKVIPRAKNLFFLNNGDGTFTDRSSEYGLDELNTFSTAASFGDFNSDGFPDLYIGNYFNQFEGTLMEITDATIVGSNQIAKGNLLLNVEGEFFKDVYDDYDLDHRGFGFGGIFSDYDNDGDQDILVNHDFGYKRTANLLLENQFPKTNFVDRAEELEMDLRINSMGTAVGDYDNNGLMDYFFTNIRTNHFMVNKGKNKPFVDDLFDLGLGVSRMSISWGANFADFDNDGDVDLFVANGDLNPNSAPMANSYFENKEGHFEEKARAIGLNDYGVGRGSVVFDMDLDGDLDLLVVNQNPVLTYPVASITKLYKNILADKNWIKIALKGTHAEMNGIGSKVEVISGNQKMIREIDGGGSSHLSQSSLIAHFGLEDAIQIDTIHVYWTGGEVQTLTNQKINRLIEIEEPFREAKDNSKYWIVFYILFAVLVFIVFSYRKKLMNH